jgi:hypothetical protein
VAFAAGVLSYCLWATATARHSGPENVILPFVWLCFAASLFSMPGWLLALPLVMLVQSARGWRFWLLLAVGTAIGPAVLVAINVAEWLIGGRVGDLAPLDSSLHLTGACVAAIVSLVYLLLFRRAQRRLPA